MSALQDKILFAKLKARDQDAFMQAYDIYVDKIYRFIFYKVGNSDDAQDLSSAVFLKAWNHVQQNSLTDFKTLPALFYRIARTTVIDHYRKRSNQDESLSLDDPEHELDLPDESHNLPAQFDLAADLQIINEKLPELKEEYREIIVLRFVDELSINEIAEVLEKNKGNVRVLLFRALAALRELLGEGK